MSRLKLMPQNHVHGCREIQRGKWNGNRGRPAGACDVCGRGPDTVPAGIEILFLRALFFGDQAIQLRAQRIDLEYVRVAAVACGVDGNLEIIVQILRQIATQLGGDNCRGARSRSR